jgi:peptide/nickel transport system substrate-binding protein
MLSAGALALSACSSGNSDGGGGSGKSTSSGGGANGATASVQSVTLGTAADSTGPAPAVAGAKSGGTVHDL